MSSAELSPVTVRIEKAILEIPRGRVSTYGRVAKRAGIPNGARQVARVLHSRSAAAKLPWWRVLGQGSSPSSARIALTDAGFEEQRLLLLSENVAVAEGGSVDLRAYGWPGEPR